LILIVKIVTLASIEPETAEGELSMTKLKSIGIIALVASTFFIATDAMADTVVCDFTSWRGAQTEDISISWVGVGFEVDEDRSRLRVRERNGSSPWFAVNVRKTNRFTTYVRTVRESDSSGENYDNRYGFRVYDTGRCETLLEAPGYVPIFGQGRVR
jgi:hypothetical protein